MFKGEAFSSEEEEAREEGRLDLSTSALCIQAFRQLSYKVLSNWGCSPVKETLGIGHVYQ